MCMHSILVLSILYTHFPAPENKTLQHYNLHVWGLYSVELLHWENLFLNQQQESEIWAQWTQGQCATRKRLPLACSVKDSDNSSSGDSVWFCFDTAERAAPRTESRLQMSHNCKHVYTCIREWDFPSTVFLWVHLLCMCLFVSICACLLPMYYVTVTLCVRLEQVKSAGPSLRELPGQNRKVDPPENCPGNCGSLCWEERQGPPACVCWIRATCAILHSTQ